VGEGVAADQGQEAATGRELIMMGAVEFLRTFKEEERESRDLLARLVAESRSFESSSRDCRKELLAGVHRHAMALLPSEYESARCPKISTLRVLALHASKA